MLALVAGVALIVGVVSAVYSYVSSGRMLRQQMVKRGDYIADNLAYNAKYGVLTEDKTLLTQLLEGTLQAGASEGSDVVGAMIRDAKGAVLAQHGTRVRDLPSRPPVRSEWRDAVAENGEEILLFRAPVTTTEGGADVAAEAGLGSSAAPTDDERKGGVEVAISKREMEAQRGGILWLTVGLAALLFTAGSAGGWYLTGRWLNPVRQMVEVAAAVTRGDLSRESLEVDSNDEMGMLAQSLNGMVTNLRKIVDNIQETSVQVASSAGQISANAKLITQGAQSQAQAAEETSTSMEEMAASIQTVAANSQSLATYVEETSSSITQMGASIEEVARSSATLAGTISEASATIEEMTVSIDQMARNLESLAGTVTETSGTVEEMTTFIASVARNAETLSAAAQKTSHTVSQMASAVNEVAKIAEEADRISNRAQEDARSGDEAVARTIAGMKTISETMENTARVITGLGKRSQEIGKILEVIEEIADQTNLLALNAAIEAARAGEAGRGFAVVADEVRKLAERSVEATKEIGEVIRQVQTDTTDAVEAAKAGAAETKQGITLADRAGLALRSIIESVSRSSQLMAQIASATAKQSQASAEVLQTVSDMNAATNQVTSAVREQAEGSKQIRAAMDNINRVMTQAAYSTKEQAAGGRQVRLAVENMNKIASQVNIATKEQADGSRQIVGAVESMNSMTQQVSFATAEQKRGGELVVKAMENISEIARDNLSTVEEMSKATSNLALQAENLAKLISVFRVQ
ncbi:MAG TPA: methyl-accepting chemotaxis protein [Vicinamibacteria bacterium]|nr:methyl-accepting chemotaxis protein [Vicinamibacteria bacterium]